MTIQNKNVLPSQEAVIIATDMPGLELREMTSFADDVVMFETQLSNLDHIARYGNTVYSNIDEASRDRIEGKWTKFGIWKDGVFVGLESYKPGHDNAHIGYWLDASSTGKGYATAATAAMVRYLSSRYPKVTAEISEDNRSSIAVASRVGFHVARREAGHIIFELNFPESRQPQ